MSQLGLKPKVATASMIPTLLKEVRGGPAPLRSMRTLPPHSRILLALENGRHMEQRWMRPKVALRRLGLLREVLSGAKSSGAHHNLSARYRSLYRHPVRQKLKP